jgi:hypothetical protein
MAGVELVAVVGAACFGVGIVFGAILVMAAGSGPRDSWPGGGERPRCGMTPRAGWPWGYGGSTGSA